MSELISGNRVDNSTLISGKEALIALANGEEVEFKNPFQNIWIDIGSLTINEINGGYYHCSDDNEKIDTVFRPKPRTITLNGVEVPAPFEPKEGELFYYINSSSEVGYSEGHTTKWSKYLQFGVWRKEEEIKQVVEVLRIMFNLQ